jgi:hypothetical protein
MFFFSYLFIVSSYIYLTLFFFFLSVTEALGDRGLKDLLRGEGFSSVNDDDSQPLASLFLQS